jgi:hypothetical protein
MILNKKLLIRIGSGWILVNIVIINIEFLKRRIRMIIRQCIFPLSLSKSDLNIKSFFLKVFFDTANIS